jgi:hypothetical protein
VVVEPEIATRIVEQVGQNIAGLIGRTAVLDFGGFVPLNI